MATRAMLTKAAAFVVAGLVALVFTGFASHVASASFPTTAHSRPLAAEAASAQQYPVMNMLANHLVQKYEQASHEQLWMERAQTNKPKSQQEQEAINILRNDPELRAAFISKVAAPIANKMFDCGMIP